MLATGAEILIVEDDPVFADVLARALRRRGHGATVAHSPDAAETAMRRGRQDFAVIDLKLGSESGLDVLPRLLRHNPAVTMLILTGYSSIATAVEAIKRGAVDYACKPVDADEVLSRLAGEKRSETLPADDVRPPSIKRLQWEHIQRVLEENEGNISATARALGMHRRTLQRMLRKRPVRR